jgi:hypothetical protein
LLVRSFLACGSRRPSECSGRDPSDERRAEGGAGVNRRIAVLYLILVLASLILGLAVGRWWTLVAAAGLGAWIAVVTEVDEVPPWFLGAAYAVLAASGIAVGVVVVRRRALASPERKALSPLFAVAPFHALSKIRRDVRPHRREQIVHPIFPGGGAPRSEMQHSR